MKKLLFMSLSLLIISCKKNQETTLKTDSGNVSVNQVDTLDSLQVEDSAKINSKLSAVFSSKILVFPNIKNKALLDSIYSGAGFQLNDYSKENLKKELERQKTVFFEENKTNASDLPIDFEQTWSQESYMSKVSSHKDVLTLTYSITGFSGGAHGFNNSIYKNFDLKKEKVIGLQDLFNDPQKMDWHKILSSHFDDPDQKEMLLVDKIPVNNNFYFNNKEITFVYNQYEITAYAAGVVMITIPFSELKPFLKPDFVTQYGIK